MNHTPCDITMDELVMAYLDCVKNKRSKDSTIDFDINAFENLGELYEDLTTGNYEIGQSICFVVTKPRTREVWAADFRDRIVHHLIYRRICDKFNRSFVADSCACIPGRGTLYGAKRLERHIRSFTDNWSSPGYYLKMDLANFFVSIDKNVLWGIVEPKLPGGWISDLMKMVIFHDPVTNVKYNSPSYLYDLVPRSKRLELANGNGLPIGNLTSQFLANVLLDILDKYIKHELKIKKYVRYVDDFIILGKTTGELKDIEQRVIHKLETLKLTVNPRKTIIQPIDRGVSFVGQTILPHRRVPLKQTVERIIKDSENRNLDGHISVISFLEQSPKSRNLIISYNKRFQLT